MASFAQHLSDEQREALTRDLDTAAGLLDDDPDEPQPWRAETEGDQLIGIVEDVEHGRSEKYDRPEIRVLVRTVSGQLMVWVTSQKVPVRILTERGVQVGDALAARYDGKKQSDAGNEYSDWTIKLVRDGKAVRAGRRLGAPATPDIENDWPDEPPPDDGEPPDWDSTL
jgi:hypothetical protein